MPTYSFQTFVLWMCHRIHIPSNSNSIDGVEKKKSPPDIWCENEFSIDIKRCAFRRSYFFLFLWHKIVEICDFLVKFNYSGFSCLSICGISGTQKRSELISIINQLMERWKKLKSKFESTILRSERWKLKADSLKRR